MEVYIRQALPSEYRHVLREIRNKDIRNIVVDTEPANIQLFLRAVSRGDRNIAVDTEPANISCSCER